MEVKTSARKVESPRRTKTVIRTRRERTEGATRTVVTRRARQVSESEEEDSDTSIASTGTTVMGRGPEETNPVADSLCSIASSGTDPLEEKEVPPARAKFLHTGSLASLLPRWR